MLKLLTILFLVGFGMPGEATVAAPVSRAACTASRAMCDRPAFTAAKKAWFRQAVEHILDGQRANGAKR